MVKWSLKFPPLSQNISCFYCVVIVGDFITFSSLLLVKSFCSDLQLLSLLCVSTVLYEVEQEKEENVLQEEKQQERSRGQSDAAFCDSSQTQSCTSETNINTVTLCFFKIRWTRNKDILWLLLWKHDCVRTMTATENLSTLSSTLTGGTTVEAVYNPTDPFTADETTAGVCQPQERRKPGIHEQSELPQSC